MSSYISNKLYTSNEVCQIAGFSQGSMHRLGKLLKLEPAMKPAEDGNGRKAYWTFEDILKIKAYKIEKDRMREERKSRKVIKQNNVEEIVQEKKTLEQLKKEHPLVVDERCFRLSWFPDTTPKCFEDMGEENA